MIGGWEGLLREDLALKSRAFFRQVVRECFSSFEGVHEFLELYRGVHGDSERVNRLLKSSWVQLRTLKNREKKPEQKYIAKNNAKSIREKESRRLNLAQIIQEHLDDRSSFLEAIDYLKNSSPRKYGRAIKRYNSATGVSSEQRKPRRAKKHALSDSRALTQVNYQQVALDSLSDLERYVSIKAEREDRFAESFLHEKIDVLVGDLHSTVRTFAEAGNSLESKIPFSLTDNFYDVVHRVSLLGDKKMAGRLSFVLASYAVGNDVIAKLDRSSPVVDKLSNLRLYLKRAMKAGSKKQIYAKLLSRVSDLEGYYFDHIDSQFMPDKIIFGEGFSYAELVAEIDKSRDINVRKKFFSLLRYYDVQQNLEGDSGVKVELFSGSRLPRKVYHKAADLNNNYSPGLARRPPPARSFAQRR